MFSCRTCLFVLVLIIFTVGCSNDDTNSPKDLVFKYLKEAGRTYRKDPKKAISLFQLCDSIAANSEIGDELKFSLSIWKVRLYINTRALDSAQYYLNESDRYRKSDFQNAEFYHEKGLLFWVYEKHDSAISYYNNALEIYTKLGNVSRQAYLNFNMANILSDRGQKADALDKYFAAIKFFEKENNYNDVISAYINAGLVLSRISDSDGAYRYYSQAMETAIENGLESRIPDIYSHLGQMYMNIEKYDSALYYLMLPYKGDTSKLTPFFKMISFHNIGSAYYKLDSFNIAQKYFNRSLNIANTLNHKFGQTINLFLLNSNQLYSSAKTNPDSIIYRLNKYKPILISGEEPGVMEDFYETMFFAYEQKGDLQKAFDFHLKADSLKQDRLNESVQEKVLFAERKYQTALKEEQLRLKEQLLQKNKIILRIVILGFTVVLIFVLFLIRSMNKKNMLLKEVNELMLKNKESAENELKMQKRELTSALLTLSHIREISHSVRAQIESIVNVKKGLTVRDFQPVYRNLNLYTNENYWDEFYTRFDELQSDFIRELTSRHIDLTPNEIRICILLRLNLTSKDISNLTNRSIRTIENIRYSIRKKMNLPESESLTKYILSM